MCPPGTNTCTVWVPLSKHLGRVRAYKGFKTCSFVDLLFFSKSKVTAFGTLLEGFSVLFTYIYLKFSYLAIQRVIKKISINQTKF